MALKYGLIGCGMIAQEHLENIKIIGNIDVIALADPVEEMSRIACDILPNNPSVFTDYREMLSKVSCDAFIIATPNHTHHEVLKNVLLTNTPVLVEKPLCINLKQCHDILALQARQGVPVWVAMEYRFMPRWPDWSRCVTRTWLVILSWLPYANIVSPFSPKLVIGTVSTVTQGVRWSKSVAIIGI